MWIRPKAQGLRLKAEKKRRKKDEGRWMKKA
jgi:hypothetical protein